MLKNVLVACVIAATASPVLAVPDGAIATQNGTVAAEQSRMTDPGGLAADRASDMTRQSLVGTWITSDGLIRLELLPDGRYDEDRGRRRSAYTGSYTVEGNRIDFVDDSGFTATGTVIDGVLAVGPDRFRRE